MAILPALAGLAILAGVAIYVVARGDSKPSSAVEGEASTAGASSDGGSSGLGSTLTIVVDGKRNPDQCTAKGHFTITGAGISDKGKFTDRAAPEGCGFIARKLTGASGTIWIKVGPLRVPNGLACDCNWKIVRGTGEYAYLRGTGSEGGTYSPKAVTVTMHGAVDKDIGPP